MLWCISRTLSPARSNRGFPHAVCAGAVHLKFDSTLDMEGETTFANNSAGENGGEPSVDSSVAWASMFERDALDESHHPAALAMDMEIEGVELPAPIFHLIIFVAISRLVHV